MKCPICRSTGYPKDKKRCPHCGAFLIHEHLCPTCRSRGEILPTIKCTLTNGEPATSVYFEGRKVHFHYVRLCSKGCGSYRAERKDS
jgi:Archaea-specific RecJ-like exonuclease, contains DnaJ-type Zn finger domain